MEGAPTPATRLGIRVVRQPAISLERGAMEGSERIVEWMLDRAGVAPRCTGPDRRALEEGD